MDCWKIKLKFIDENQKFLVLFCLKKLHRLGLNPLYHRSFLNKKCIIFGLIAMLYSISLIFELVLNAHQISTIIKVQEAFPIMLQYCSKGFILISKRTNFQNLLLNECKKGWDTEKNQITSLYFKKFKLRLVLYYAGFMSTCLVAFGYPIVTGQKALPFIFFGESKFEYSYKHYIPIYLFLCINSMTVIHIIVGCDGLFLYFLTRAIIELRFIGTIFENDGFEGKEGRKRFVNVVRRHSNVLKYIGDINNTFSILVAFQFLTTFLSTCFSLLMLSINGTSDVGHFIKILTIIGTCGFQIGFFCVTGDELMEASLSISGKIFSSYLNKNVKTRDLKFVIHRAQKAAYISMGGVGFLDLQAYQKFWSNAMSFWTWLLVITGRQNN